MVYFNYGWEKFEQILLGQHASQDKQIMITM